MKLGNRTILLQREGNKTLLVSAWMLVQSATGTHTALPLGTHITRSFRQMFVHWVVERGKKFWKQYLKDDLIFISDQIKWYPANEGEGSDSPCLEYRPLNTLWGIQKEYDLPADGVSLSDLAGSCSISVLLQPLWFFFLPIGLVSCTSGRSDREDHWATGLEGGGGGGVSLQLDQLRCCHRGQ